MGTSPPRDRGRAYAVFRPRRGAWVAWVCALASVLVFGGLAILSPTSGDVGWAAPDRLMTAALGVGIAVLLVKFATLRAVPSAEGLRVVNLVGRHDLSWASIVTVGFHDGGPWAVVELADTEQVAVMAIQRADGARARREASRLAALVSHHSSTAGPSPS
ncbi:MAG TPA: PH domain-containing protein [Ornithinimicrobium sp.]|uniref:PH domain-containing protein n=1 Tax=Ornithinimicrobium sp. TaxID=1977084 RepID=UPI002B490C80|nr:PH domain-containing protein [Ornithinimicrobium sp.]HKJ11868.1 PH domain-containing protein [Ornithinimicrobium sp.]